MPIHDRTDRRRAILDAALECFVESGVAGATLDAIRARSGASVGSLYHHYPSKAHLAEALYVDALTSYAETWRRVLEATRHAERGVKQVVRAHFRWIGEQPGLARFLFSATSGPGLGQAPSLSSAEVRRRFDEDVAEWIRDRCGEGRLRPMPPGVAEALWIGPSQALTRQWIGYESLEDLQRFVPELAAAAWNSLRPVQ